MKTCDIIIPVWNELEFTRQCIETLRDNTRYPYRLIVIDNGSLEPTALYLDSLKEVFSEFLLIRNNSNLGFVKAVNQGLVASSSPYVCILNNDTSPRENWLKLLVDTVESGQTDIGLANPTSNVFGKDSPDGSKHEWQELDSCKGFCMLIKREVIKKIGIFDEVYGMGYFEEKDFSRRAIESGYICIRAKASFVFHKDRVSFDRIKERDEIFKRNEEIFNKRWGRPKSIAFVARDRDVLKGKKGIIYELLKKGHRVNVFASGPEALKGLKDHLNIRFIRTSDRLFRYSVLFKLWERRRKKRIELVVASNDNEARFFNKFRFVHGARISGYKDIKEA